MNVTVNNPQKSTSRTTKTAASRKKKAYKSKKQNIPVRITDNELLNYIENNKISYDYIERFKKISHITDSIMSDILNLTERTVRNYRQSSEKKELSNTLREKLVLLISLYKHGAIVFGTTENFNTWLDTENFILDKKAPREFLKTVTGIRFIEDRLTGMEYGDNA
ncbi:antitoxin Xre/MbcA/ParS toxin-binding domain-containing protein [Algibacter sp. 2305UL17-15]|uniref:antitoxin Xre/MbcA/ParS toxin-binding domain-containing protein n=1 Tax=Algibacter sp. 2305UL17-15 TaxID=3231268 RepID=UPI00345AB6AB